MTDMPSPAIIFSRGVMGICPHCGQRSVFKGMYAAYVACPNCSLPLEDKPGEFTGAAYFNAGFTGLLSVLLGVVLVLAFPDLSLVVIGLLGIPIILVIATLLHRPIKGLWIATLYYSEALKPPEADPYYPPYRPD
jgi:uncharacterized protein (DUF983 family)